VTTRTLKGSMEEQMAALIARQNESEQSLRELQQRNVDLERQLRARAPVILEPEKLPTLKKAMAEADEADRSTLVVKTEDGIYVHPHAFDDPQSVVNQLAKKIGLAS
jgi:dihydroxyacetone kinase-like predicted kinase